MPAISQLAAYYLDCISRDRDDKVSAYLTNAYGNVDYGQVFSRPEADVEDAASYSPMRVRCLPKCAAARRLCSWCWDIRFRSDGFPAAMGPAMAKWSRFFISYMSWTAERVTRFCLMKFSG